VRRTTPVDQRSSLPGRRQSPSWVRVILDTIKLTWERRRQYRVEHDGWRRRLWLPVLGGVVVLGAGLLVMAALGSGSGDPAAGTAVTPAPRAGSQRVEDPTGLASRSAGESSRAIPSFAPSVAKAAAGAEIADRSDIAVSPAAATVLRKGTVDGRVLIVLASLASADLLATVELPSSGPSGSIQVANVELGVEDVDYVLDWLDVQRNLRPDRMEVHREGSMAYLLLIYETPEPPGLFPS
jgi:hypothetical protein